MPWRASGDRVRSDEEVRRIYIETYGTRRTDIDILLSERKTIEIPFGDGLITLTWEQGPDDWAV
jgi:hypothetical protein